MIIGLGKFLPGLCFLVALQTTFASHGAESDIEIQEILIGQGAEASHYSTIEVHYVGKLDSGRVFDSSLDRGEPFKFVLGAGQVIPGWEIGIRGMKRGGKRQLKIPSELAYGSKGAGAAIPPNATLIFDVELISVISPAFRSITNAQLNAKRKKGIKLIDIRRPDEWRQTGIVEGSIQLTAFDNRGQFIQSFIASLEQNVQPDEEFVVICRSGNRTAALSNWLATRGGYQNVLNVQDGILSWISEGRSVIKSNQ